MASIQEVNYARSDDVKSKTVQSELKTELEIKECSTTQHLIETDKEMTRPTTSSQENSFTAIPELKPGSNVETVQSNSGKDLLELAPDGVSEHVGAQHSTTSLQENDVTAIPELKPGSNAETVRSNSGKDLSELAPHAVSERVGAQHSTTSLQENDVTAIPELKPGSNVETVRSNSGKDLTELAPDGVSEHVGAHFATKKRAFSPDIQNVLGYRERNLYFQPLKRSRLSFGDNSKIGEINSSGPISTDDVFPFRSQTTETSSSMVGMFDDAEDDQTFDFKIYKKLANSASTIRPDLVAAILGAPPKSNTAVTPIAKHPEKRRRVTNKKQKKISTEKERMAAVAILDGEIDLLRILTRDDCDFLGKKCFIFTLRHLEWVLDEDVNSQDSRSRQEAREILTRNLKENCLMTHEFKKTVRNSTNLNEQGCSTLVSTSTLPLPTSEEERVIELSQSKENSIANEMIKGKQGKDVLAAEKLEVWKTLIQTWKRTSVKESDKGQFPLVDGPMSVFFPVGTLQFMESINIKALFDFLCLKKTESGLVVEMFRDWRKKCGLKDLNLLPLAKHLTGINARIEASLKGKLDAENDLTKGITGPMVILSGAAKEFLVDHSKVFSGTQFIETKTKHLADQFSDWRLKRGLSELKGSGKVAMISAWKTQIKDELELENSKRIVIPKEEIRKKIESISETTTLDKSSGQHDAQSKRRKVEQSKSKTGYKSLGAHEALNSINFFHSIFFEESKRAMFESVGIRTAQMLLDADRGKNSDLLKAVIKLKSDENKGKEIKISSCISLLYDWSSRVKKRINDLEKDGSDAVFKIVDRNRKSKGNRNWKKTSDSVNPFDALSTPSKEFLIAAMNIRTASEFLLARTTDIANAFIKWRGDKGMSALKGLGAVASISGWKKMVRVKAASLGDLSLAELNLARNTKSVVGQAEIRVQQPESIVNEPENQLGAPDTVSNEAEETLSMELKSKNILSVLSCTKKNIFHFEVETRKVESNGYKTYIRYLGSDPESIFDLAVDLNSKNEKECIVIKENLAEKVDNISGRKPYDSLTHGTIELNYPGFNPGVQPNEQGNDSGVSLEEMIRMFVLQSALSCGGADDKKKIQGLSDSCAGPQMKSEESCNMFNVFEVLRKGKKSYMLYLVDPIERGQLVELCLLPTNVFYKSTAAKKSGETIRSLIQGRLHKLPVELLLEVLRFLKKEIAALVSKHFDFASGGIDFPSKNEGQSSYSSLTAIELVLARRRIHWVAMKVYENLRSISTDLVSRHISTDLLWSKIFVDKFRDQLGIRNMVVESIREEIKQEVKYEFINREFNGFASTMDLWCPLAKRLFNQIVDLFGNFSTEFGGDCVGNYMTSELSRLVPEFVLELRKLSSSPGSGDINNLSKIALMYKRSIGHDSNVFPSFEDITQECFLRPYTDAMLLCNEPASMLNSIKEARIVATKRNRDPNENETTQFKDLHDTKILDKNNIDVRWYVDTQILAVAQSAIRCGISVSTPDDTKELILNIELQIMEAVHTAMTENNGESLPLEDFKMQQGVSNPIMQSQVRRSFGFNNRSLAMPSSMPFFFGFIWPLLRGEGWKLIAGKLPTDVSFAPPVEVGIPNRTYHPKDSLARQRSQLAREASSFGLGYIPRLTKRLLIKCFEKNETTSMGRKTGPDESSWSPSTKVILEKFASLLLLNVEKLDGSTNGTEKTKIKDIVTELLSLFNKLAPLTFEKEDECHLTEGKQWCDVLDCRYLFKFLIIIPNMLQKADLPNQQYLHTISVIHELLAFLSNNHQELFGERLKLPNEESRSESKFPSRLPSQIKNYSRMNIGLDLGKPSKHEESEDGSVEIIRPKDRVVLTDFVAIVMSQTIMRQSTLEDSNRQGRSGPCIVCRHCLGIKNGGKYFFGSYDSIATASTVIEKHVLKCPKIGNEVKQEVVNAKIYSTKQRRNLPIGAQSAFFVRLYDRLQSMAQPYHEFELGTTDYSKPSSVSAEKRLLVGEKRISGKSVVVGENSNISRVFNSHLDVMEYIQSAEPWKSKKPLAEMISKYYNCLDYGGKLYGTKKSGSTLSSEWLYSKLAYKK